MIDCEILFISAAYGFTSTFQKIYDPSTHGIEFEYYPAGLAVRKRYVELLLEMNDVVQTVQQAQRVGSRVDVNPWMEMPQCDDNEPIRARATCLRGRGGFQPNCCDSSAIKTPSRRGISSPTDNLSENYPGNIMRHEAPTP